MLYVSLAIVEGLEVWGYLFIEMDILVLIMLSLCVGLSLSGWISNMELLLLMLSFFIDYAHAYWYWPIPLVLNWLIWPLLTLSPTFPPFKGELTAYDDGDCEFDDLLFCCSYYSLNIISSILVIGELTKLIENLLLFDCSWWWWLFCDMLLLIIFCYWYFGDVIINDYWLRLLLPLLI